MTDQRRQPWHLEEIRVSEIWQRTGGKGAAIALFDSGVDTREGVARRHLNPDHGPRVPAGEPGRGVLVGRDFTRSGHERPFVDEYGHGTKMAGILCACRSDHPRASRRCVGVAPDSAVVSLKVALGDGSLSTDGVARAVEFARELAGGRDDVPPIRVALLPFEWEVWTEPRSRAILERVLVQLVDLEILPILPAGDSPAGGRDLDDDDVPWSKLSDRVVVAAASRLRARDAADPLTGSTNRGARHVHIAAPGQAVLTVSPMAIATAFGTSAAAAITAGAATLLAADTGLVGDELRAALLDGCRKSHAQVQDGRFLNLGGVES